jgi:hypothetical protein
MDWGCTGIKGCVRYWRREGQVVGLWTNLNMRSEDLWKTWSTGVSTSG